jgi:hypothetical protein
MKILTLIPCWSCDEDAHYQKTVISPRGVERLVYECPWGHTAELPHDEIQQHCEEFATDELRTLLAKALARVTFDADGVHIL